MIEAKFHKILVRTLCKSKHCIYINKMFHSHLHLLFFPIVLFKYVNVDVVKEVRYMESRYLVMDNPCPCSRRGGSVKI